MVRFWNHVSVIYAPNNTPPKHLHSLPGSIEPCTAKASYYRPCQHIPHETAEAESAFSCPAVSCSTVGSSVPVSSSIPQSAGQVERIVRAAHTLRVSSRLCGFWNDGFIRSFPKEPAPCHSVRSDMIRDIPKPRHHRAGSGSSEEGVLHTLDRTCPYRTSLKAFPAPLKRLSPRGLRILC